ncbi:MAG: type I secretion C-terminal target domain-containing protein, partial [Alphaproteobacteria bacterium]|nr:type I secretion C-terminal target domain-containing protein [Alphaproteobacteria bacterium]
SFIYTPNAGYFGSDTFDYTLEDGQGGTDIGTVTLTVNEVVSNPDDTFIATAAAENFDGGAAGSDTVSYINSTAAVTVDLLNHTASGGFAAGDTFISIENLIGSNLAAAKDTLKGDNGSNTLHGLAGDDYLYGNDGADFMYGGDGADFMSGDGGADTMYGDAGNDTLKGRDGDDSMFGGAGSDYLEGGNGNDTLHGGDGADTLKGSAGTDTFVFHAMSEAGDTIIDFNLSSGESIDISDILSGVYDPLTDLLTDFVQIVDSGANSILSIDTTGTATSFVQLVTILNVTGLTDENAQVANGTLIV